MEQKRTLWIIAAAGMFLLVVLGAAYILYSPAKSSVPASMAQNYQVQNPATQSNYTGWSQVPGNNPGNQLLPPSVSGEVRTNDLTVYSDKTVVYGTETNEGTTIDLNAFKAAQEMAPAQETYPQNINITVNLPESKYEPNPTNVVNVTEVPVHIVQADNGYKPVREERKMEEKAPVSVKKVSEVKPVSEKRVEPKVTVTTNTKSGTTVTTTETKVVEKKVDQFWVQASSYSNKKTAENARSKLDDNKIPADIFTYQDAKGQVFYRVRVGPYTTKSEAEYWRTKIDKIPEFSKANSYITSN